MNFYVAVLPSCAICKRPATHEVRASGTQLYGKFCKKHADQHCRELNREEKRSRETSEAPHA